MWAEKKNNVGGGGGRCGLFSCIFFFSLFLHHPNAWNRLGRKKERTIRELKIQRRRRQRKQRKAIGFISNTTTLHVHHAFCRFLSRRFTTSTWKCLISRFVEDGNTRQQLSFSSPVLWYSPLESTSKKFANIWRIKRDKISVMKFKAASIHLFKWRFRDFHKVIAWLSPRVFSFYNKGVSVGVSERDLTKTNRWTQRTSFPWVIPWCRILSLQLFAYLIVLYRFRAENLCFLQAWVIKPVVPIIWQEQLPNHDNMKTKGWKVIRHQQNKV